MSNLSFNNNNAIDWAWKVAEKDVKSSNVEIKSALLDLNKPVYLAKSSTGNGTDYGVANVTSTSGVSDVLAFAQKLNPEDLGDDA